MAKKLQAIFCYITILKIQSILVCYCVFKISFYEDTQKCCCEYIKLLRRIIVFLLLNFSPKLLSFLDSPSSSDANCRESDSGIFSSHYSTNTQASFISKIFFLLSFILSFFLYVPLSFSLPLSFHNLLSMCILFSADSLSSVRETNSSFNNVPLNIDNPNVGGPNVGNPNVDNLSVGNPNTVNPNVANPNVVNPNEEKRRTEFLYPPTITVVPGSSGSLKKCSKSNLELLESVRTNFYFHFYNSITIFLL